MVKEIDWKRLYKHSVNSPIEPKSTKDYIKKYCYRLRRPDIENAIRTNPLYSQLSEAEKFGLYAAMGGMTRFYKSCDYDYIKRVFVYFFLDSLAKLGKKESDIFNHYKEILKSENKSIDFI